MFEPKRNNNNLKMFNLFPFIYLYIYIFVYLLYNKSNFCLYLYLSKLIL